MKKNISPVVSTFSKTEICRNNFGIRAEFLSNLGKVGYPIVDGYFISSDFMKNLDNGKPVLTIPKKFLEFGTFYLRSSTEKKEWPGPDPFPYIGFNKDTITKFSKIYGKKNLSLIYINHLKNFGARVFDLDADSEEMINLSYDPSYKKVLNEMEELLQTWLKRTNDPFDTGKRLPITNMLDIGQAFTTSSWLSKVHPEYANSIKNNFADFKTGEQTFDIKPVFR